MKFEHQICRGNLTHIGPETEGLYCFYCTTLNCELKNADNCNAMISRKMERKAPKVRSHFNARSLFLIIYTGNGSKS